MSNVSFLSSPNNVLQSTTQSMNSQSTKTNKPLLTLVSVTCLAAALTGCQTPATITASPTTPIVADTQAPSRLQAFSIRGKIGIITPQNEENRGQSGSAFYVWAQDGERFAIDLTGALGIGHTVIEYNGQTATLVSEKTGTISANTPEELLLQATGWQAPISQLPYWISGSPAPSDSDTAFDATHNLITTTNGEWVATFDYADSTSIAGTERKLPSKIKVQKQDGHKVILTIAHDTPSF